MRYCKYCRYNHRTHDSNICKKYGKKIPNWIIDKGLRLFRCFLLGAK